MRLHYSMGIHMLFDIRLSRISWKPYNFSKRMRKKFMHSIHTHKHTRIDAGFLYLNVHAQMEREKNAINIVSYAVSLPWHMLLFVINTILCGGWNIPFRWLTMMSFYQPYTSHLFGRRSRIRCGQEGTMESLWVALFVA